MNGTPDRQELLERVTTYLSNLIKINTTNPPGNEIEACHYIESVFRQEGLDCEIVDPGGGRGSMVARLKGSGAKAPVLLLSHLDVVPAQAEDWTYPPFAGTVTEDAIWGRGSLDCKSLTAQWMALLVEAHRGGLRWDRDLIFCATADEEAGGTHGVGYLVKNHWDLIEAEFCLNEGGGTAFKMGDMLYYTCQTAEKSSCPLELVARDQPGHAAMWTSQNAVVHLARAVQILGSTPLPLHVTPTARLFLEGLAATQPDDVASLVLGLMEDRQMDSALDELLARGLLPADQRKWLNAMLRNTASPTMLQAGSKINVIPAEAKATVDVRLLPGQRREEVEREVRSALGRDVLKHVELRWRGDPQAAESPPETDLTLAIRLALEEHSPGAHVLPYLVPGGTDARYLRPRGVVVYGFAPMLPGEDLSGVHGIDERLSLASLEWGTQVLWSTLRHLAGNEE